MATNALNGSLSQYIDRGVQTDARISPSEAPQPKPTASPQAIKPGNAHIPSPSLLSPPQAAYTHSSRSCASANRAYKYPELSSARPSSVYNPISNRVVSLPGTELAEPVQVPKKRIVSLPEAVLVSRKFQGLSISGSDSLCLSSEDDNGFARVRVYPPDSDIPRTPSPPSSQESSIMIIGGDANVARGFLCHSKDYIDQYLDEAVWSTWTKSPPRPIPALHGPLSLPYARCPSGAEGTLIEGSAEELPRMIWGLEEMNGLKPSSHKNTQPKSNAENSAAQIPSSSTERPTEFHAEPKSAYEEPDIFIDTGGVVFETGPIQRDWHYGFEDQGNLVVSDPSLKPGYPKSAAPSYIPSTARIFIEPRQVSHSNAPYRSSAVEIAQEYRRQQLQQQNNVPTPSSTYSLSTPALSLSSLHDVSPSLSSPGIAEFGTPYPHFEPQNARDEFVDESQNLRQFVFDAFNEPQVLQGNLYQELRYNQHQEPPRLSPTMPTRRNIDLKTAISMSQRQYAISKATSSHYSVNNDSSVPPPPPPSPQTSQQKTNFQPRSVPLAKLMQRTLSTVPEEDGSNHYAGQGKIGVSQQDSARTGLGIDLTNTEQAWRTQGNTEPTPSLPTKKSVSTTSRSHSRRAVSGSFDQNGHGKATYSNKQNDSLDVSAMSSKSPAGKKKSGTRVAKKNRAVSA